ncbi:MAG: RsmB/NOP family class I SAM-dependent RNA methyltransferase [Nanoarchaeota archaeon]|nr:RsmB/NOP family class I SAM-dependent RNA methyltransferase [Nanoarchaeota archaeon]
MDLKPQFVERMRLLLGKDYENYEKILSQNYLNSIRCNTLKISPDELKKRLSKKWTIKQLFPEHPEIMIITSELEPGEIGRSLEHQLGYFYVQEVSSMMPPLVLEPKDDENILDLCASPGSKTTEIGALMKNKGNLIANDVSLGRIKILSTNLQRCGVTNCIVAHHDGNNLASRLNKLNFKFDKILVDAPCSGEGNVRTNKKTSKMFNEKLIKSMSNKQKQLAGNVIKLLKEKGIMIYSTCTHGPEENEEVVDYLLANFPVEVLDVKLPLKSRQGVTEWKGKKFHKDVVKCARIYPQDNNTEGFFIAKLRRVR